MKALFVVQMIGAVLLAACARPGAPAQPDGGIGEVNSFDACLVAGGAIMESLPRQCAIGGRTFVEDLTTGPVGETRRLLFKVGPARVPCQAVAPQQCLIVNGELFYDSIDGFAHMPGKTSVIEVERTQICDPDIVNSCPPDTGIYTYRLIRTISQN